jgi:hypothetical protein
MISESTEQYAAVAVTLAVLTDFENEHRVRPHYDIPNMVR